MLCRFVSLQGLLAAFEDMPLNSFKSASGKDALGRCIVVAVAMLLMQR